MRRLQAEPAVSNAIVTIQNRWAGEVSTAPYRQRSACEAHQLTRLHHRRAARQRGPHALAVTGSQAVEHTQAHAKHHQRGGSDVVDGDGEENRITVTALGGHHAAHGLQHRVEARLGGHRSLLAEAVDGHRDDVGLYPREARIVDPQPLHHAQAGVVDHGVGRAHQLVERLARVGRAKVDGQPALAAVVDEAGLAERVAGKRFHFDHVGAELRQQRSGVRAGQNRTQVQHAVARQGAVAGWRRR